MGGTALAQEALEDYMKSHALAFQGEPPCPEGEDACACWSRETVGFEARMAQCLGPQGLDGGRVCRLRGVKTACYLLRGGRSLYVFPRPIPGAGASPGNAVAVAASFQASAWNEGDRGYVLVAPR
jgi:hypothetical protein